MSLMPPPAPQADSPHEDPTQAELARSKPESRRQARRRKQALALRDGSASQTRLIWRKYRTNPLGLIGLGVLIVLYVIAAAPGFFSPHNATTSSPDYAGAPPQQLRFSPEHGLHVLGLTSETSLETLAREYVPDPEHVVELRLFAKGDPYKILGLIPADRHLLGPSDPNERVYLLGADQAGVDMLSKINFGAQISLSIGLIGVLLSALIGIIVGGISGYFGGVADSLIQRVIEFIMSIPTLPLWLGLAAAIPPRWGIVQTYLVLTCILSLVGWTGMARVIRGRVLQARDEDFVTAARLDGAGHGRIILRHLMPSFMSHIIASLSLAVPSMILAETALSFLGMGLRAPAVSWGVLLRDAQQLQVVVNAPWMLLPGLAVVLTVVAFNFVGDALRDAADPYGK
ncbi:ABC transporter permease [Parenemella sanctibonifatiensis]|nr:ABC transporter permease [Parenemella sanctibonifatiensis]